MFVSSWKEQKIRHFMKVCSLRFFQSVREYNTSQKYDTGYDTELHLMVRSSLSEVKVPVRILSRGQTDLFKNN